ncbi:N-acetyl-gamma-glutamyl-phosphate reductase [Marininema halotolerans]|uniref:N-acetyl-gamma-glutamyl-phosphate reductase n=1 Tax=Marininema halotolerans TaxID=1155944 RepID=A0A1I6NZ87_9BACL|nr:N-acetyl-gamma-glutamyl-phosphate reductase [Marininema halotolerans]SFS33263.1 N-acetyl-gamma-glutamyl-phosphate reductase [Marininema halotolerans]
MKVAVLGASGYGSAELIRLLENHPHVEIEALISSSQEGEGLMNVYPHLSHINRTLEKWDVEQLSSRVDAVFFAAPAGVSSQLLPEVVERGLIAIDLAGDFRLTPEEYRVWYGKEPAMNSWISKAVYGLSEWNREEIKTARLLTNPGCYATATLLGLLPLAKAGAIAKGPLIIDGKSGVSGAGRGLQTNRLFSEVEGNLFPYKVAEHQHTPEIEHYLERMGGASHVVTFTPQIVPMSRGILATIYAPVEAGWTTHQLREAVATTYHEHPFIRLCERGRWPRTKDVTGSNFCDLQVKVDERTGMIITAVAIDNLMKGAAGQAVQNLNIIMGWQETMGLKMLPLYP